MLLNFIWDLYLCFCFPFLYISLVRSVRRWCFLWQTALIWKALWNPCRYGSSQVTSRYLDFMPFECYKLHGHATHLMSVQCLSDTPCLLTVHHGTHAIEKFLSKPMKKQQVAWQFLSEKVRKRWAAIALWIHKGRNNLTAQIYMSRDCFLMKVKKESTISNLVFSLARR